MSTVGWKASLAGLIGKELTTVSRMPGISESRRVVQTKDKEKENRHPEPLKPQPRIVAK